MDVTLLERSEPASGERGVGLLDSAEVGHVQILIDKNEGDHRGIDGKNGGNDTGIQAELVKAHGLLM